jgi:hypothetical protein
MYYGSNYANFNVKNGSRDTQIKESNQENSEFKEMDDASESIREEFKLSEQNSKNQALQNNQMSTKNDTIVMKNGSKSRQLNIINEEKNEDCESEILEEKAKIEENFQNESLQATGSNPLNNAPKAPNHETNIETINEEVSEINKANNETENKESKKIIEERVNCANNEQKTSHVNYNINNINRSKTYISISKQNHEGIQNLISEYLKQKKELEEYKNMALMLQRKIKEKTEDSNQSNVDKINKKEIELENIRNKYDKKIKFLQKLIQKTNQEKKEYEKNISDIEKKLKLRKNEIKKLRNQKPFTRDMNEEIKSLRNRITEESDMNKQFQQNYDNHEGKLKKQKNKIAELDEKYLFFDNKEKQFLEMLKEKNLNFRRLKSQFEGIKIMMDSQRYTIRNLKEVINESDKTIRNYSIK